MSSCFEPDYYYNAGKIKKRGAGGNLRKTNKKARKRLVYEKGVTAEKNKLFFTICTLFAGNHTK